jgi:hypothetical protein
MKYSYGIVDRKNIRVYQPHLFQKRDDLLVFPGKDFRKWYSNLKEYLDGIYQINAHMCENGKSATITDLNLVQGILNEITFEMENIFNPEKELDLSYYYISTMDKNYKKIKTNFYGRYRYKVDRKVVHVTPELKYMHMMEIVDYAHELWGQNKDRNRKLKMVENAGD